MPLPPAHLLPDLAPFQARIDSLMEWAKQRIPTNHHRIKRPTVYWHPRPRRRAVAHADLGQGTISLDVFAAMRDQDLFMVEVLPHEFAHHVAYTLFGDKGHGVKFKQVCRAMGINDKRHTYAASGNSKHRRVPCSCTCGAVRSVSYTVARKILCAEKNFVCAQCKSPIVLPQTIIKHPLVNERAETVRYKASEDPDTD